MKYTNIKKFIILQGSTCTTITLDETRQKYKSTMVPLKYA